MIAYWMKVRLAARDFLLISVWPGRRKRCEPQSLGPASVILRTGMVLEADGGALAKMLLPFKLFAGGPIMPGTQWVSWIHRSDHIGLIQWALTTADGVRSDQCRGPRASEDENVL